SPYGYTPTEWLCILFIVLFGVTSLIHTVQAIYSRLWWLIVTASMCGILEILGWCGRLWSSINVDLLAPYIMQMTTTIIAPTPLIAANFVILGQIIRRLGPCYSRLSPMWYTTVFISCDIVALVIQAVGGATAATAVQNANNPKTGGYIMLAGIAFQFAAITFYMVLASEFVIRCAYSKPLRATGMPLGDYRMDKKTKLMLLSLATSSIFIYFRSRYVLQELSNGWSGTIIHTQVYFNVFDGTMITLAMFTLNFLHPAFLLGPAQTWREAISPPRKEDDEGEDKIKEEYRLSERSSVCAA
ncbi:RTA1-domain-containing protein, partial [Sparassis latifolia]